MKRHLIVAVTLGLFACGSSQPKDTTPPVSTGGGDEGGGDVGGDTGDDSASSSSSADAPDKPRKTDDAGEFAVSDTDKAARPKQGKLKPSKTEAAVRFFVVDKVKGTGIAGIVISLTSPSGKKYYTSETDADGFAEVLVPIAQTYDLVYLSLGRHDIAAKVKVADQENLNLKLTMRYERFEYPTAKAGKPEQPAKPEQRFVLKGVEFESGKAKLTGDSHARLEPVVEYMTHKPSARIEISGHTDNVGKPKKNMKLSQERADAVRKYLISKGIDGGRIDAVGYGDTQPIAPNDTDEGRQKNRRIEATEK